jgi:uncharacterized RDD family membrane protein YckC
LFCAKCGKELPVGAIVCPYCATPVPGAAVPPPSAPPTAGVSGFDTLTKDQKAQDYWFKRVFAFAIDAVIVFVPLVILTGLVAVFFLALGYGIFNAWAIFVGGWVTLFWAAVFILYNATMESNQGASIGKGVFNLKVVSKSGSNPSFEDALVRNISKIYWLLLILDVIVGLALSKDYKQKYSDTFLGTSVVPKMATI